MPPLNLDLTDADREALQPFLDPMYGSEQQIVFRDSTRAGRVARDRMPSAWRIAGRSSSTRAT